MTTITVLAGCPSAVAVTESLLAAGVPIGTVFTLGPDATDTAGHAPMTSAVSRSTADGSVTAGLRIGADLAMLIFTAEPARVDRVNLPATIEVRTRRRSATHWDPVVEAIASGSPRLPVSLRLTADGRTVREESRDIRLDGNSSQAAADLATAVGSFLDDLTLSDHRFGPPGPDTVDQGLLPGPCLPWPTGWDEVDWSRPAQMLRRTVRAAVLPGRSAWTWFGAARLAMGAATRIGSVTPGVPAGTVVGHVADGVVVQTGRGTLRVHDLRDLLGPVDPAQVTVGTRLGHDTLAELATLTRRVRDLERLVLTLAGDTDLLDRPPRAGEGGSGAH